MNEVNMMTRSGKKNDCNEMAEDGEGATADPVAKAGAKPGDRLDELTALVKSLMQSQATRDQRMDKESARQEQRWKSMQHQFQQIQVQVKEMTEQQQEQEDNQIEEGGEPDEGPSLTGQQMWSLPRQEPFHQRDPKLLPLTPDDDIEHFLTTFERMAQVCRWPREEWAVRLVPLLTGKARSAYVLMDIGDSEVYDKVKDAILAKYEITADTYRRRFRALDIHPGETPRELYVRLKDTFYKWAKPEKSTVKDISELMILEQFLRMVHPDLEVWIRERAPKSAEEASQLAEIFISARTGSRGITFGRDSFVTGQSKSDGGVRSGGIGQSRSYPASRHFVSGKSNTKKSHSGSKSDVRCYHCNQIGHTQYTCPATTESRPSLLCSAPRPTLPGPDHEAVRTASVLVNGQREEALLDTGSFQSVVLASLVPRELWSDTKTKISCVHGDEKDYPMAEVYLTVGGQTFLLPVALAPRLPYAVILGLDIPTLLDLVSNEVPGHLHTVHVDQDHNLQKQDIILQAQPESAIPSLIITRAQSANDPLKELPFYDEELEVSPAKPSKSRAQRRRDKFRGSSRLEGVDQSPNLPLELDIPPDISSLQQADPSLKSWFHKVSEVDGQVQGKVDVLADATYVLRNGVLYECKGKTEAIALPQALRHKVMELGHSVPWAGHLGFHKSLHRIASRFVWPGMYTELQQFCKSCQICQLTLNKGVARAHLQPLPVIETPFERIGMDVVGPLERSSSGNRYILVICDYATRYPEAFPLRSVKARQVANCLLQLFSRVGIAKEVLTDCGTNFQSKFLQQVYRLLGIKGIKTTPYHPQSDGLVERFNQTLKNMLRKFVTETGSDWDQWLPYLLFAYREVPQASTGFSPFELLYGRQVRGPLDLLKEQWENPEPDGDNVIAYVLKMRERLEQMSMLAQQNMKMAQNKQKTWYDKKARERTFQPGQQVLLLLPTTDSKLLARWQGPYKITKRLSNVNYELYMPDRRKKHQVFHINLLKEFMQQQQPTTQQQQPTTQQQQQQPTTQQQQQQPTTQQQQQQQPPRSSSSSSSPPRSSSSSSPPRSSSSSQCSPCSR
uniref:Gypsy retrotransposon integrase-like protein 1 n=1 Tax=Oreochromis niloticus TaxID=8128 RepID=A0A669D272_ORENI